MQMIWKLGKQGPGFSYSSPPPHSSTHTRAKSNPTQTVHSCLLKRLQRGESWGALKDAIKAKQAKTQKHGFIFARVKFMWRCLNERSHRKENAASLWGQGASLSQTLLSWLMLKTGGWKFHLGHAQRKQWWWGRGWTWGCHEDGG